MSRQFRPPANYRCIHSHKERSPFALVSRKKVQRVLAYCKQGLPNRQIHSLEPATGPEGLSGRAAHTCEASSALPCVRLQLKQAGKAAVAMCKLEPLCGFANIACAEVMVESVK